MIEREFKQLLTTTTATQTQIDTIWSEICNHYSSSDRHYHNLSHLENLLIHLTAVKYKIKKWPAVVFALVFHDVIYNPQKQNNEEKSAQMAENKLTELGIGERVISSCSQIILATKHHDNSDDSDTNIFIDADLSILGSKPEDYKQYSRNIRKEYAFYTDSDYNKGRLKLLQQFFERKKIYKSDYFSQKFEVKARENIKNEIRELQVMKN